MIYRPRDLAGRTASRRKPDDGYVREAYALRREDARKGARAFLNDKFPKPPETRQKSNNRSPAPPLISFD
jgi:hypothetical protein